jgi:hypothetical protein
MIASTPPTEIRVWPIDKLIFCARNPRKNDTAVDRMEPLCRIPGRSR